MSISADALNKVFVEKCETDPSIVSDALKIYLEERLEMFTLPKDEARVSSASMNKIANRFFLDFYIVYRDKVLEHRKEWTEMELMAAGIPVTRLINVELLEALKGYKR